MTASLDYFHGRTVLRVEVGSGSDDPYWTIILDGGGRIFNFDPVVPVPAVEKLAMTNTVYGAGTALWFGTTKTPNQVVVTLTPTEYGISDDTYTDGEPVFPERPEAALAPLAPEEQ